MAPGNHTEAFCAANLVGELQPIADSASTQALAGQDVVLDDDQNRLLIGHYLHCSAHWAVTKGIFINKPTPDNQRLVHEHKPQKGYPQ